MAQFSLSPAVTVREVNLTGYVPNIPSAKTGAVLRADKGPCLDVTAITNENDLVSVFGKPTAANYQDWFQCWNFLQYASSLYVVRPIPKTVKNAGIGISGPDVTAAPQENFYNAKVAEHSLENFADTSDTLYFINKDVTSDQRLAIAACSSPQYFKSPIGLEYTAVVSNVIGTTSVTADGTATLTNGSQVVLNGGKLAVVTNVVQTSTTSSTITFDRAVSAVDVNPFYGKTVSASVSGDNNTYTATFEKTNFTFKLGTKLNGTYVTAIGNANASEYSVTFSGNPSAASGTVYSSTEIQYQGTTAYNSATSDFGVQAGVSEIKLQPGFILEAGVVFNIVNGGVSAGATEDLVVASVDYTTNTVKLISPTTSAVSAASGVALSIITSSTVNKVINGINYFDKVYDNGLIKKTRMSLLDKNGNPVNVVAQSLVSFSNLFDYQPNWGNDEFALVVLKKNDDGYYERFEQFTVSYNADSRDVNGNKNFVEDVLFNGSKAVYGKVGDANGLRVDTATGILPKITSTKGDDTTYPLNTAITYKDVYDGFNYTQGDIMDAFSLFADPENIDINILINHEKDINYASTIAETRKDCVAIVAPFDYGYLSQNTNNDCTAYLLDNFGSQTESDDKIFGSFGTYSAVYGNMKYQYDKFNNVNRWINVAGDIAGLYAQTDNTNDPWWAPAGTQRGVMKNAIKLAFNPNKQNRDELYVNSINPIMPIAGEGSAIVWGQKTATATPSAFDRVNVRRLLIYLEKSISTAVNIGLFEFNDAFTRTRLFNIIDPFLRSVQNRRGLYAYKVVVDESNNTSQVIDQNGLVIDCYLQPTRVAEFIRVNAIVTPTGASFSEFVGTF